MVRLNNKVTADRVWNRRPDTYAQALQFANDAHAGQKILNQAVPPQPKEEPGLFFVGQGEQEDGGAAAIGAARRRGGGGRCFGCDKSGHQVRDCPLLRNLLHGRKGGGRGAGGRGRGRGGGGGRARGREAGGRGGRGAKGGGGRGGQKNFRHRQLRAIQAILNEDAGDWEWEDPNGDKEEGAAGNE